MSSTVVPPEPSAVPPQHEVKQELQRETSPRDDGQTSEMSSDKDLEKQSPDATESPSDATKPDDEHVYPPTRKVIVIMVGLYLAMFLMALVSCGCCRTPLKSTLFLLRRLLSEIADNLAGPYHHRNSYSVHD